MISAINQLDEICALQAIYWFDLPFFLTLAALFVGVMRLKECFWCENTIFYLKTVQEVQMLAPSNNKKIIVLSH